MEQNTMFQQFNNSTLSGRTNQAGILRSSELRGTVHIVLNFPMKKVPMLTAVPLATERKYFYMILPVLDKYC